MSDAAKKNAAISALILSKLNEGADFKAAFDAVLGAGRYEELAGALWTELRARKATR